LTAVAMQSVISDRDDGWIQVSLVNGGSNPMDLYIEPPEDGYEITVKGPDGKKRNRTLWMQEQMHPDCDLGNAYAVRLFPYHRFDREYPINRLYEMSNPGQYTVIFSRGWRDENGNYLSRVISNSVTITVLRSRSN
jgi:hypothetical protein